MWHVNEGTVQTKVRCGAAWCRDAPSPSPRPSWPGFSSSSSDASTHDWIGQYLAAVSVVPVQYDGLACQDEALSVLKNEAPSLQDRLSQLTAIGST